jgi:hypothetical protein
MIFIRRHLLRRSDGTPRRMAYARTALLFDPNVMSKLQTEERFILVIEGPHDSDLRTLRRNAMSSNFSVNWEMRSRTLPLYAASGFSTTRRARSVRRERFLFDSFAPSIIGRLVKKK